MSTAQLSQVGSKISGSGAACWPVPVIPQRAFLVIRTCCGLTQGWTFIVAHGSSLNPDSNSALSRRASLKGDCEADLFHGLAPRQNFALPAPARLAVMDKIVANLGCNHDFIALIRESFGNQFLAQSVSIRVSRIKQRDAEIERLVHQRNRFALGKISPPPSGNRPQSEPHFAHCQVGIF